MTCYVCVLSTYPCALSFVSFIQSAHPVVYAHSIFHRSDDLCMCAFFSFFLFIGLHVSSPSMWLTETTSSCHSHNFKCLIISMPITSSRDETNGTHWNWNAGSETRCHEWMNEWIHLAAFSPKAWCCCCFYVCCSARNSWLLVRRNRKNRCQKKAHAFLNTRQIFVIDHAFNCSIFYGCYCYFFFYSYVRLLLFTRSM